MKHIINSTNKLIKINKLHSFFVPELARKVATFSASLCDLECMATLVCSMLSGRDVFEAAPDN